MSKHLLLQGITIESHLSAVKHALKLDDSTSVIMSVAYMNKRGLSLLREDIKEIADKITILTGIRNGVTSAQGLSLSLALGCSTYVVDTGSNIVFHPKIYVSRNQNEARLIVGSANLTNGGLQSNIEASIVMNLDLKKPDNLALVEQLENLVDNMRSEFPNNVFPISDSTEIEDLLVSNQVVDENLVSTSTDSGPLGGPKLDSVPRMILKTDKLETPQSASPASRERRTLVWESNPLTERSLNIPTNPKTNPTGNMLFTKGAFTSIKDHRHYFRDEVFQDLNWRFENEHKESAEARFRIVVNGTDCGTFTLKIAHDTRTDTRTYRQKNGMTQLHWGEAREIIAKEELLDCRMRLYRDEEDTGLFVLEIH